MSWSSWAAGVLQGIGAPVDAVNLDTLWAWSGAESGDDRMRWNNPLNTTQPEGPGNVDANSVGVKIYPTESQGVRATVVTLLNGYYWTIVDHLRRSVPRTAWSDCCRELGTWGTGCPWIARNYGAVPGVIPTGGVMTPEQETTLLYDVNVIKLAVTGGYFVAPDGTDKPVALWAAIQARFTAIDQAVARLQPAGGSVDLTPLTDAIAALRTDLHSLTLKAS